MLQLAHLTWPLAHTHLIPPCMLVVAQLSIPHIPNPLQPNPTQHNSQPLKIAFSVVTPFLTHFKLFGCVFIIVFFDSMYLLGMLGSSSGPRPNPKPFLGSGPVRVLSHTEPGPNPNPLSATPQFYFCHHNPPTPSLQPFSLQLPSPKVPYILNNHWQQ